MTGGRHGQIRNRLSPRPFIPDAFPAVDQAKIYIEEIQCPPDGMIYNVFDRFWMRVERRQRGHDDRPHFDELTHCSKMSEVKGRLAYH